MIVFEKGLKIVCPNCSTDIAFCNKDQQAGQLICREDFVSLGKWDLVGVLRCPLCFAAYGRRGAHKFQVHSNHGWRPE